MQVAGAGTLVGQAMDEEGVRMEVEDHWSIGCEEGSVFAVRQAVGVIDFGN